MRFQSWILSGLLIVMMTLTLAGCGKKPSFVDAPQSKKEDQFPHTYPRSAD